MTICIGFIPNEKTVMMLQDGEITHSGTTLSSSTQNKIKKFGDKFVMGAVGSKVLSEQMSDVIGSKNLSEVKNYFGLKELLENSYHYLRTDKYINGVLKKYGIKSVDELITRKDIVPEFRNQLLNIADDGKFFPLDMLVASYFDKPRICTLMFPGEMARVLSVKEFYPLGRGDEFVKQKMNELVAEYTWKKEIPTLEAIDMLVKAGNESAKHTGVGGPFQMVCLSAEKGKKKIIELDARKLNMAMYVDRINSVSGRKFNSFYRTVLDDLANERITSKRLYLRLIGNFDVGYEFKHNFRS